MRLLLTLALCAPALAFAEDVTVETFVRAESDYNIRANMEAFGFDVNEIRHLREPTTTENQPTIRMNQDTLYSGLVLDLSEPVEITLPEVGGRYMSMHVVNQDHYMFAEAQPGTYSFTEDKVGTRFAMVTFRTFADITDTDDIAKAHAAQDGIAMSGGGKGPYEAPDWNLDDLSVARKALSDIATLGFDASHAFGNKEQTHPIDHLIGAAAGWGGLPRTAASYVIDRVSANDGETPYAVTVNDVPVDAFWSITVYNDDGYMQANELGVNSYNNFTARPNANGAYTIHFGGCEDGRLNCIPVTNGWNHTIRFYEPRAEILEGSWTFPAFEPVD